MKRSTLPAPKGRAPISLPSSPLISVSGYQALPGPRGHQPGTQPPPEPTKAQDQDQDRDQDPDQDQDPAQDEDQDLEQKHRFI
jgi:hypothetical protein